MNSDQPPNGDRRPKIPPLQSKKADGAHYKHPDNVLEAIAWCRSVPESLRIAEVPRLPSEALVNQFRGTSPSNRAFWDRLFRELSRRATGIIYETLRGLPESEADDLVRRVVARVMERIANRTASRNGDLLEIRFKQVVRGEAVDALRAHLRSPLGALRRDVATHYDDDGDEMERPLEEIVASDQPGPEELLILRHGNRRHQLLRMACQAVADRQHLKAAVLRWGYDWPITSNDPQKPSLTRHFGVSESQMRRWLDGAMDAMRRALAKEPEMLAALRARMEEPSEEQLEKLMRAVKGGQ